MIWDSIKIPYKIAIYIYIFPSIVIVIQSHLMFVPVGRIV